MTLQEIKNGSTYAARKIFQESCAHYARKLGKLK